MAGAAGGNHTTITVAPDPPSSMDIMGGVKNRARLFTEAIMIMVCPVLLAILRGSAQSKGTSVLAGLTLLVGIAQFLIICLPKTVNNWACCFSKLLIHFCVVLVMVLAAVVMTLIGLKSLPGYLVALVILGLISFVMLYKSWRLDEQEKMSSVDFKKFKDSLDASANFSAAITAVLFLGLEALALEGLIKDDDADDLKLLLALPLGWSFVTCAIGMFSMLLVSVHPLIDDGPGMRSFLQVLGPVLGICVCIAVYCITGVAVGEMNALGWLSPSAVPPGILFYHYCSRCFTKNTVTQKEEHEQASLELTKITFAAFLAVSVIAIETSIGGCGWFIVPTALAIITGVQWRLMTPQKEIWSALARAAEVACFISHFCMAFAVIPFTLLALAVVKKPVANCIAAAPLPSN